MIVSFSVSNFRSFATEETFSLAASTRLAGQHENHTVTIPDSSERVLRIGVLYGANGAGKSNLFKALRYVKSVALEPREKGRGTGREPFRLSNLSDEPSTFDLQFIVSEKLYRFGFKADDHRITEEWLIQVLNGKEKVIYERICDANGKVTVQIPGLKKSGEKLKALATIGGPQNQSFLATVFITLESDEYSNQLSPVIKWLGEDLQLISPSAPFGQLGPYLAGNASCLEFASGFLKSASTGLDHLEVSKKEISEEDLRSLLPESLVSEVLAEIVEDDDGLALIRMGEGNELLVERTAENHFYRITVRSAHETDPGTFVHFDLNEESDGTRRLLNLMPALYGLQTNDKVYFIDEIDRSLHPILVKEFINFFLKSCPNTHGQVIVTTHESNLLDLELLRRDEIWFAEKDQASASHLYALTDFKVRQDLEIRKNYLKGRFGAVPFLGDLDRLLIQEKDLV